MVYECKQRLNELGRRNKVTLVWIPGHEGIPGNENADKLARLGAENRFIGPEPRFGISMTTRKHLVKKWLRNEHSRTWLSYNGARHTKIFCGTPSKKISDALLNLSRTNIKRVIEVVTNHCSLNEYLFKIGCTVSPKCLCRHDVESGSHIIAECPRYRTFRWKIFDKPELHESDLKLEKLDIDKLEKFLKLTKRHEVKIRDT
jgi:RNase H